MKAGYAHTSTAAPAYAADYLGRQGLRQDAEKPSPAAAATFECGMCRVGGPAYRVMTGGGEKTPAHHD